MKMSLTRALREIKTLNDRIEKKINHIEVCSIAKPNTSFIKDRSILVEDFRSEAKSEIESIESLLNNLSKMKAAILKANNETEVSFEANGKRIKMTIAEALDYKSRIALKKKLLERLKRNLVLAEQDMSSSNKEIDREIMNLKERLMDSKEPINKSKENQISNLESEKYKVIEPKDISLRKYIESLENEIYSFTSDIDYLLSEVNAKTEIEVDIA